MGRNPSHRYVKGMFQVAVPHQNYRPMGESTPPTAGEEPNPLPLPRDPPAPPGYVDPLEGSGALDDLTPDPEGDPRPR